MRGFFWIGCEKNGLIFFEAFNGAEETNPLAPLSFAIHSPVFFEPLLALMTPNINCFVFHILFTFDGNPEGTEAVVAQPPPLKRASEGASPSSPTKVSGEHRNGSATLPVGTSAFDDVFKPP